MLMAVLQNPDSLGRRMFRTCRWLLRAGACVALAACAPVPIVPDVITAAPEPGRAIIIGWGNTAAENARAALTPERGSRVARLFVSHVNTEKISFGENIARVPPGEFDLTILCGIYVNYRYFTYEKVIHAALNANRVYRLRSEPEGRRCEPFLEDVTGKGG
jgi:hypothetical protein